jgi:hypothetical protein
VNSDATLVLVKELEATACRNRIPSAASSSIEGVVGRP